MKKLYLLLAIIGAIVPYFFFFQFIQSEGLSIPAFISALFVNGAGGGFSADLLLTSFVFWLLMFQQVKRIERSKAIYFHCSKSCYRVELRLARLLVCT